MWILIYNDRNSLYVNIFPDEIVKEENVVPAPQETTHWSGNRACHRAFGSAVKLLEKQGYNALLQVSNYNTETTIEVGVFRVLPIYG